MQKGEPLQKPPRFGHGQASLPATLALRGFPGHPLGRWRNLYRRRFRTPGFVAGTQGLQAG